MFHQIPVPPVVRAAIETTIRSFQSIKKVPVLDETNLKILRPWLILVLTDVDVHIAPDEIIEALFQARFRNPRPLHERETRDRLIAPEDRGGFPLYELLEQNRFEDILDNGPEAILNEEVPFLLLNPYAVNDITQWLAWRSMEPTMGRNNAGRQPRQGSPKCSS